MAIDYTAFLKGRVKADPERAKQPDQQVYTEEEQIKDDEDRGVLFKAGQYLSGDIGERSLATDVYETGQGVAKGTVKATRDLINLIPYAIQYSPYALTPAQGVISVGGGLLAGLAGDKELDDQLSFSTMMDFNKRASRTLAEEHKLEELRENINENFAPLIDKLEQDYDSPLSRPAEIFGEFFSPVPMLQPVLWANRLRQLNNLNDLVQGTRKTLLTEIKKQATASKSTSFKQAVKGKTVDILEDPVKRAEFIKDNVPNNKLSAPAQRELNHLKAREKQIKLINYKNKNIVPALKSEAAASAMGAYAMSIIEQSTSEETGSWLAPLAGISVAVVGPPMVIGHGRSASFNILGAYFTARARAARRAGDETTALQFDDKALDSFIRSRGVNPNKIEDTQGNVITDPEELRIRKRQLLNATPTNMKYYAMLAKQLEGLDPKTKKQVYDSMQEYTRLYEKTRQIALKSENPEFADSFVPLVHNVIQLQSIRALQTTLLKNVHAGFFLSPKNFFKNKLTSDFEALTDMQREQIQFLGLQLNDMKALGDQDNEVDILLKQLREMVKDVDATIAGSEQTISTAGVGILGKIKSKVRNKDAAEDNDIIIKGDKAIQSFLERTDVGLRLNRNNKADMLKNWGASGDDWEIQTRDTLKEHYDVQNDDLITKGFDNANAKVNASAEKNLKGITVRIEDSQLSKIHEAITRRISERSVMLPNFFPSAKTLKDFDEELKQGYLENLLSNYEGNETKQLLSSVSDVIIKSKNQYLREALQKNPQLTDFTETLKEFSAKAGLGGIRKNKKGELVTQIELDLVNARTDEKARTRLVQKIIRKLMNDTPQVLRRAGEEGLDAIRQNHTKGELPLIVLNRIRSRYMREAVSNTDPQKRFDSGEVVAFINEMFDDLPEEVAAGLAEFKLTYKNNLLPFQRQNIYERKQVQRRLESEFSQEARTTEEQRKALAAEVAKFGSGGDNLFLSMIDPDIMESEAGVVSTLRTLKNNTDPDDMERLKSSIKRAIGLAITKGDKGEGSFLNKLDSKLLRQIKDEGLLSEQDFKDLTPVVKVFDHMNEKVSLSQNETFKVLQGDLNQLVNSRGKSGGSTFLSTVIKASQDITDPIAKNVAIANAIISTGDLTQTGLRYTTRVGRQTKEEQEMISRLREYLDADEFDQYQDFIIGERADQTPIQKLMDELDGDIKNGNAAEKTNASNVKKALNDIFITALYQRGFKKTNETINFRNNVTRVGGKQHTSGFLDHLDAPALEQAFNDYDDFFKALFKNPRTVKDPKTGQNIKVDTYQQLQDMIKISRNVKQTIGEGETVGGMPTPFKVESVISRIYGVARGVVSARYVFSEWGIRQMRQGQAEVLRSFLTDPEAVNVAHEIFVQGKTSSVYAKNFYQKLFGTPTMAILINQGISQDKGLLVKYLDGAEQQVPQSEVDIQMEGIFG